MTRFMKQLPVGLIPEQRQIAAMRNDVIDIDSIFRAKSLLAFTAENGAVVFFNESIASAPPFPGVEPLG